MRFEKKWHLEKFDLGELRLNKIKCQENDIYDKVKLMRECELGQSDLWVTKKKKKKWETIGAIN